MPQGRGWLCCHIEATALQNDQGVEAVKILVLRNQNPLAGNGGISNLRVVCPDQSKVQNVHRFMTKLAKSNAKSRWQLRINHKIHSAASTTGWSIWSEA